MTRHFILTATSAAALVLVTMAMPMQASADDRQIVVEGKEIQFKKAKPKKDSKFLKAEPEAAPLSDDSGIDLAAQQDSPVEKPKKIFKLKAEPEAAPLAELDKPAKIKKLKAEPEAAPLPDTAADVEDETADAEPDVKLPIKKPDVTFKITKKPTKSVETEEELTGEDKEQAAESDKPEVDTEKLVTQLTHDELVYLLKIMKAKRYRRNLEEMESAYHGHLNQTDAYEIYDTHYSHHYGSSCNRTTGYNY